MATAEIKAISLTDFLKLPYIEESPAWEYVDEGAVQKSMAGEKHSFAMKIRCG